MTSRKPYLVKPPIPTENQLQYSCVDYLRKCCRPGVIYHHSPNEGERTKGQKIHMWKMGLLAGWPDLMIFDPKGIALDGDTLSGFGAWMTLSYFIEFKIGHNSLSKEQEDVRALLEQAGFDYAVVRNIDTFMDLCGEWDIVKT